MASPNPATVEVGDGGGAPSPLQNPRVLLIAGGGILLAVVFLLMRRGSGAPGPSAGDSQVAGPNAALAIGSLESRLKETSGRLEEQLARQGAELDTDIGALSGLVGTAAQSNYDYARDQAAQQSQIRAQLYSLMDPANANRYQMGHYQWARDSGYDLPDEIDELLDRNDWRLTDEARITDQ